MNLPLRTVFVPLSVMLWAAAWSPAQSVGDPAPAPPAAAAPQGVRSPAGTQETAPSVPPTVAPAAAQEATTPSAPTGNPASVTSAPAPAAPKAVPVQAAATPPSPSRGKKRGKGAAPESLPEPVSEEQKPYVIGSLDILQVSVWNDPKLSGIFDVRPDGILSLPLIGEMKADGLTVADLTQLIRTKLAASVMEDPEVNIQVVRINSKKFYIFGGCLKQGEFPLVTPMTILDAFANCGGFKDFANLKKIYVLRGAERLPFNYKEVSQGKHMEQNRMIQNGDRIFVPE